MYIPVYCFNFCFHLTIERCALNLYTHAQYKIKCTIHVMFMLFHKKTVLKIFFCLESDNSEMKHKQLI